MRYALSISAFAHVAILASAFIALPDPEKFKVTPSETVPVEIIAEQDLAKPKPPEKPPEPEQKPEPAKKPPEEVKKPAPPKPEPKKQVAALPPEPEPEPEPVEKPPEIKPVEEKPPEPEPEPKKVEEPPKQVEKVYPKPKRKPKPPKKKPPKKFDDTISALLNKLPDESPPERSLEDIIEESQPAETESVAEVSQTGTQLERSEIAAIIRSKMARCWNPPTGLQNAGSLQVKFKLSLKPNGELLGNPVSQTTASDALTRAAVESARRALIRCAPYGLPQDTYDVWKEMVLNFDPSSMF